MGVESAWRRRQTIKRGVTKKVKLVNGNFITEYPVPSPVYQAVQAKYRSSIQTTEFSSVDPFLHYFLPLTLCTRQSYAVHRSYL